MSPNVKEKVRDKSEIFSSSDQIELATTSLWILALRQLPCVVNLVASALAWLNFIAVIAIDLGTTNPPWPVVTILLQQRFPQRGAFIRYVPVVSCLVVIARLVNCCWKSQSTMTGDQLCRFSQSDHVSHYSLPG